MFLKGVPVVVLLQRLLLQSRPVVPMRQSMGASHHDSLETRPVNHLPDLVATTTMVLRRDSPLHLHLSPGPIVYLQLGGLSLHPQLVPRPLWQQPLNQFPLFPTTAPRDLSLVLVLVLPL